MPLCDKPTDKPDLFIPFVGASPKKHRKQSSDVSQFTSKCLSWAYFFSLQSVSIFLLFWFYYYYFICMPFIHQELCNATVLNNHPTSVTPFSWHPENLKRNQLKHKLRCSLESVTQGCPYWVTLHKKERTSANTACSTLNSCIKRKQASVWITIKSTVR